MTGQFIVSSLVALLLGSLFVALVVRKLGSTFTLGVCRACLRREGLAFLAFVGASGAGVVLTCMLAWNIRYLQLDHRSDDIAYLSFGMLILFGIMQLSLHRLLGSKQAIELEFMHFKASMDQGGDNDSTPTP